MRVDFPYGSIQPLTAMETTYDRRETDESHTRYTRSCHIESNTRSTTSSSSRRVDQVSSKLCEFGFQLTQVVSPVSAVPVSFLPSRLLCVFVFLQVSLRYILGLLTHLRLRHLLLDILNLVVRRHSAQFASTLAPFALSSFWRDDLLFPVLFSGVQPYQSLCSMQEVERIRRE